MYTVSLPPSHWFMSYKSTVAICVCSWGIIASLQSLVSSFGSMLVLRALLGIGEAAFVGIPFYLSFFYKRDELAFRTGLFISAAPLATSFAGTLAWCIIRFGDLIPIASWRTLLLVEGFPSVVVAVFVYRYIPDRPETAQCLSPRERKVALLRLRKEKDASGDGTGKSGLRWREIREALLDPKCYLTAVSSTHKSHMNRMYADTGIRPCSFAAMFPLALSRSSSQLLSKSTSP